MAKLIVAIDGPSGAGKSTLSKMLAKRLDYVNIDTGAMYRTVALAVSRAGIDLKTSCHCRSFSRNSKLNFGILRTETGFCSMVRMSPRLSGPLKSAV